MFDELLRALKDRLFAAPARWVGRFVSADVLTWIAFVAGLATAWAASRGAYGVALALWIANRVLDGLDGTVARELGTQHDFGGYLDIVLDVIVYAAVPIGLAIAARDATTTLLALVLVATFYVNVTSWLYLAAILERGGRGAAARGERTTVTMPPALVAGAETVVFYALFFMIPDRLPLLFTVMAVGVGLGVVQRFLWARRALTEGTNGRGRD